jgi:hypothetical protein
MRAGFRACYARELQENPDARGSMRFSVRVGATGRVDSVDAQANGVSSGLAECAKARVRVAQFAPPAGGTAVLQFPVTFAP